MRCGDPIIIIIYSLNTAHLAITRCNRISKAQLSTYSKPPAGLQCNQLSTKKRFLEPRSINMQQSTCDHNCCATKNVYNKKTHTHPFNGPFCGTTRVSQYQKGKTNLDFTGARDSEWQWHQLGHMQVCTSLQTDNHATTSLLTFFTGQMPFLPPNQQCQSTEGKRKRKNIQ